jgi:N-dimethylarginine dimethylaminohydrolase
MPRAFLTAREGTYGDRLRGRVFPSRSEKTTAVIGRAVLLCAPRYFTVRDVKNPFMRLENPVDARRAQVQWNDLRAAFERCGVRAFEVDPVEDLEDMVFTANQVFAGSGARHARFAVPSRMRYPSRQREVPFVVAWFRAHGYDVLDLDFSGDEYFEAHGDALWQPETSRVWAGYGIRSSRSGVERFAEAIRAEAIETTPIELVDPTFYHLDTCFAPLSAGGALYYPAAFSGAARERLAAGWPRLYEISQDDAGRFACNGVAVNGRYVASYVSPAMGEALRAEGLEPLIGDLSEFEKAGGSAFCMKTFVDPLEAYR